ncbi:MAG TPA: MlaD family protein [Verrucomicrobiae bacterium]|nr:MlaD family protein [Verrucomicrobiae bacterium]
MALQDLTPQLRTRLNRMERAVGWFVIAAMVLMVAGFVYFLRNTAARKGWFIPKYTYYTSLDNAAGLKVGDPVKLMGFNAGSITAIVPNAPGDWYGVSVYFVIQRPHYGYIWDDSRVKVSSDLFGNRFLEITKGTAGVPTILEGTNRVALAMLRWREIRATREQQTEQVRAEFPDLEQTNHTAFEGQVRDRLQQLANANDSRYYTNLEQEYWITPIESKAVNERLEQLVDQVESALPNILNLTNKIGSVLDHSANLASNLNVVALNAQPASSNLAALAAQLRGPGALGEWALGSNSQQHLESVLSNVNSVVASTDTNLTVLVEKLALSLDNLAGITSNLNSQVQANTNILGSISKAVVDADDLVQGLKRHWLFRSAFKTKTPNTNEPPVQPLMSPKARGQR